MLILRKGERDILHASINSFLGAALIVTIGLWAFVTVWQVAFNENPIVKAFAAVIENETAN